MPESTRHRQAFDVYWRLGPTRSIERLHAKLSESRRAPGLRTLYEWSRRYLWQQRLMNLERAAREEEDQARIAAIREMGERQAREALLLQQKGAEWLLQIDAEQVSAEAAIRALVEGARLERLVRGEPTERTDHQGAVDARMEGLSDEQLDALIQHAHRAVGGEGAPAAE